MSTEFRVKSGGHEYVYDTFEQAIERAETELADGEDGYQLKIYECKLVAVATAKKTMSVTISKPTKS